MLNKYAIAGEDSYGDVYDPNFDPVVFVEVVEATDEYAARDIAYDKWPGYQCRSYRVADECELGEWDFLPKAIDE